MTGRRGILVALVTVAAVACLGAPAIGAPPTSPESQIKAGIVYNLALAVTWPEGSLAATSFVIGVVGHDDTDPLLTHLAGKDVRRHALSLLDPVPESALATTQILYISRSEQGRMAGLLAAVAGRPLLTVSDIDGFCEAGGMVQLRRDRNRIQLRVNRAAAERVGLKLSSQLLKVAEIVEGGD